MDRPLREDIRRIQERLARIPARAARPLAEILGYDEHGLPSRC
ncbi:MAG: type II toxin-antitoxin system VapB family antitoxin [Gemmatimonadota bacterium]